MKKLTVNVQIQFDQLNDSESLAYAIDMLNLFSQDLQRNYPDISPMFLTNSIYKSNLIVNGDFVDSESNELMEGMSVDVPEPTDDDMWNNAFTGTVHAFENEYVIVVDQEENYYHVEPNRLTICEYDYDTISSDEINADEIKVVANSVNIQLTDDEVKEVIERYPDEAKNDPTATWELIVENVVYQVVNER